MTITFLLLSLTVFCVLKNTRAISQISKEHLNKRLVGHEIYEIRVNGRHDCIRKCFFLPMCKSTDYNGNDHMCKLNDVDSTSVDITEFEDKPGAVFSDITEWPMAIAGACGHRPCSEEQQRCLPHKNTYRCADTEKEADCKEIKNKYPLAKDGVYTIQLWLSHQVKSVYCDMTTDGGGWTVFQYRFNGSVNFTRNFESYSNGFGSLDGEFWLGLETIQEMTSRGLTAMRVDLTAADNTAVFALHNYFHLDKGPAFTLHVDEATGTADINPGRGMPYHNGYPFSTLDADHDDHDTVNCAAKDLGGWWYRSCAQVNLNGEYVTPGTVRPKIDEAGMIYKPFRGVESLKISKLMFRMV